MNLKYFNIVPPAFPQKGRVAGLFVTALACLLAVLLPGCDGDSSSSSTLPQPNAGQILPVANTPPLRIAFLGDSLTAGYGLDASQAFPALIEAKLNAQKMNVKVINAGVSGNTTADGLKRVDWVLGQKPDIVVVALGANDGLRAQDVEFSKQNLRAIIQKIKKTNAEVLLLGMTMPPNYGPVYVKQFKAIYTQLAQEEHVALMPFMLEGVAGNRSLNQSDGIHPTAKGQTIMADNILPFVKEVISTHNSKQQ